MSITRAMTLGWADLFRPRIFTLVLTGIALTILLFVVLQAGIFGLVRYFVPGGFELPWVGVIDVGNALSWGSLLLFPVIGFFLMAPVAVAFSGVFAERVTEAVEEIHYPNQKASPPDFLDGLLESLGMFAAVLGVTIMSLILTPFLGPLAPLLLYIANGWLLGREFFRSVGRRHLSAQQASDLHRKNTISVTMAGIMIAFLLTIPFLNIAVPVLAAAVFTHLFHIIREKSGRNSSMPRG